MISINGVGSLALVIALAGCTTVQAPPVQQDLEPEVVTKTRIVDTGCSWIKPIFPAISDVLADSTAAQINAHNKSGMARCGWKPPKK